MKPSALPILLSALFTTFASVSAQNASELVCKPYIPYGPNYGEPTGNIEFSGNGAGGYGYPNNPMTTQGNYHTAWSFFARTCNSTSLGVQYSRDPICNPSSPNCVTTRTDYIQIINTKTGNCMTWDRANYNFRLSFVPCVHAPNTTDQLWKVQSTNDYSNRAHFDLYGQYGLTFIIESDGKTPGIYTFDPDGTIVNATWIPTTSK